MSAFNPKPWVGRRWGMMDITFRVTLIKLPMKFLMFSHSRLLFIGKIRRL
jgi:hypothetical protein